MIISFEHKGLKKFFTTGSIEGINPQHEKRLRKVLAHLHAAETIETMDLPGYRLHPYKGDKQGVWSVDVSGNFRIWFTFHDGNAYNVDYGDPH